VFHFPIWGLGALFGGLSPLKPRRGDGTEQTVDKSWISCSLQIILFFRTSFYELTSDKDDFWLASDLPAGV